MFTGASIGDLPEIMYNIGVISRPWVVLCVIFTWAAGLFLIEKSRENNEVRRWAGKLLLLKLPGTLFLYTFGYCFLYAVFNLGTENIVPMVEGELQGFYYNMGIMIKRWTPFCMFFAWFIGFLIIKLFRKNKDVQKMSWTVFVFRIPGLMFLFTYGYCFLYGLF